MGRAGQLLFLAVSILASAILLQRRPDAFRCAGSPHPRIDLRQSLHQPPAPPLAAGESRGGIEQVDAGSGLTITYAAARRAAMPVPSRFGAPLPSRVADFLSWTPAEAFPPRAYVRDMLCAGDPSMVARLRESITRASAAGDHVSAIESTYGTLVDGCSDRVMMLSEGLSEDTEPCATFRRWITPDQPPEVRAIGWTPLASCHGPAIEAAFANGNPTARAIVDHLHGLRDEDVPIRLTPAMESTLVDAAAHGEPLTARSAAFALAEYGPQGGATPLVSALAMGPDSRHRRDIDLAFSRVRDPASHMIYMAECARDLHDPVCTNAQTPMPEPAHATDPAGIVRGAQASAQIAASTGEARAALLDAALECARTDRSGVERLACERLLAVHDRPRALQALAAPTPADVSHEWDELARTLRAYPIAGALEAHLRDLRLIPAAPLAVPEIEPTEPESYLDAAGRATVFDSETDEFPNEADSLMRQLARLAAHTLDDVVFEEIAPASPDDATPYRLRAYTRGERLEVDARSDLGDYYDLDAVLGLMNTLLRERQSDVRFIALTTMDQMAHVAAGPIEGLRAAVHEHLLETGDAMNAARIGGDADDRVGRQLAQ